MSHADTSPLSAITPQTGARRDRISRFTTPAKIAIRTAITDDASTAAAAAGAATCADSFDRSAIATVTAVLDTRPPRSPVTVSPRSSPNSRPATNPTNERPVTRTTISQISRGLSAFQGPMPRLGRIGRIMPEMTASFSTAVTSAGFIAREMASSLGLATSSVATTIPAAPAMKRRPEPASIPTRKVAIPATSVVAPTCPSRLPRQ